MVHDLPLLSESSVSAADKFTRVTSFTHVELRKLQSRDMEVIDCPLLLKLFVRDHFLWNETLIPKGELLEGDS